MLVFPSLRGNARPGRPRWPQLLHLSACDCRLGLAPGLSPAVAAAGFNPNLWDFIKIGTRGPETDPGQFVQGGAGFTNTETPKNVTLLNNATEYHYTPGNPLTSGTIEFTFAEVVYTPVGGTITGGNITLAIWAKLGAGAFASIVSAVTPVPATGLNPVTVQPTLVALDVAATGPWDAFKAEFSSPGFSFVQKTEECAISMLAKE